MGQTDIPRTHHTLFIKHKWSTYIRYAKLFNAPKKLIFNSIQLSNWNIKTHYYNDIVVLIRNSICITIRVLLKTNFYAI